MKDPTEDARRVLVEAINSNPATDRQEAEKLAEDGKVWDTEELRAQFEVVSFLAPFVMVRRKADGVTGTMMFQHHPRFYFNFKPE